MIIQGLQNELLINIDAVAATAERNQPLGNAPFINFVMIVVNLEHSNAGKKLQDCSCRPECMFN